MAEWTIDVTATLPAAADDVVLTVLGDFGGTFQPSASAVGEYSFNYDDADGPTFLMLFELVNSSGNSIGAQVITHGPYDPTVVGTEVTGGR